MSNARVAIVTGANVGIGLELARYLCHGNWEVILACRNEEKAQIAINSIQQSTPNAKATFIQLDLADLASVRAFVCEFKKSGKCLHALINNAGVMMYDRQLTKDGFEMTIGTNHLGHFLLTLLLLDEIKTAAADTGEARIVNLSSKMQEDHVGFKFKPLDFDDLMYAKKGTFGSGQAYRDSKLMNVMFTFELGRQLSGTGVTVTAVHPGTVTGTTIGKNLPSCFRCMKVCFEPMMRCCGAFTSEQSAEILYDLVTSPKFKGVTGAYFSNGREATPGCESLNEESQAKLWTISAQLVKLDPDPSTATDHEAIAH